MMYFLLYSRNLRRKYIKRMKEMKDYGYKCDDSDLHKKLSSENPIAASQAKMLCTIAGTAMFTNTKQTYLPMFVSDDGHRTFAMEDIKEEDLPLLEEAIELFSAPWVRMQLAHILWLISNNYRLGQIAVNAGIELFNLTLDPNQWVICYAYNNIHP